MKKLLTGACSLLLGIMLVTGVFAHAPRAPQSTAVGSAEIVDGSIVNADINAAINLATTGTLQGRNPVGTDITGNTAHDTTELHGVIYKATAAATVTLDAAADAGFGACSSYRIRDAAEKLVLDLDNAEKFNLAGTAQAAGVAIEATGAGEYCTVCATTDSDGSGTDGYDVYGETSGWASE